MFFPISNLHIKRFPVNSTVPTVVLKANLYFVDLSKVEKVVQSSFFEYLIQDEFSPREPIHQICLYFFFCCCTLLSLYTVFLLFVSGMASYYTKEENKYMEEKAKKYHYIRNGGTSRVRMTFSCNHVLQRSNMRANTCLCLTSSVT